MPESVFERLQISKIILLETDHETIIENLAKRDGKTYKPELIKQLILEENRTAHYIAQRIQSHLHILKMNYSSQDIENALSYLS